MAYTGVVIVHRGTYTAKEEGGVVIMRRRALYAAERTLCVLYAFCLGLAGLTRTVKWFSFAFGRRAL